MKWLYGILCLFFLILFHEFGHFVAAKLFGVKVESFSIGFGPVLLHKNIRGTDFRLSLFPLGGYCGMKGEKDFLDALDTGNVITGEKDSLYGIHPVKRALIGFAGPFFNFIFAIIASSIIAWIGYSYYSYSNQIKLPDSTLENVSSVAKEAGILDDDIILSINGIKTENFSDISKEIIKRPDEDVTLLIDREGKRISINLHTDMNKSTGEGKIGIQAVTDKILEFHTPHYNVFTGLLKGIKDSCEMVKLTFKGIGTLFKGVEIKNAVSGPARVTSMLGTTVKEGFSESISIGIISILDLMAIISVSLFIMNLLPVPVLDGGLILFALIETVLRRKIPAKIQYYTQFIGFAFILFLLIIGMTGDITYFRSQGK